MPLIPRSDNADSIWLYNPSFPLAIVATILYQIPTCVQFYLTVLRRHECRHRYFVCVLIGSSMEVAGYAIRAVSTKKQADIVRCLISFSFVQPLTNILANLCNL